MVGEEELAHSALCLFDLLTLRRNYHSVRAGDRAGGLELWHFLDTYQTHPAGGLKFEVFVITKRRNAEAFLAADVDQPGTFIDLEFLPVDRYFDLFSRH